MIGFAFGFQDDWVRKVEFLISVPCVFGFPCPKIQISLSHKFLKSLKIRISYILVSLRSSMLHFKKVFPHSLASDVKRLAGDVLGVAVGELLDRRGRLLTGSVEEASSTDFRG